MRDEAEEQFCVIAQEDFGMAAISCGERFERQRQVSVFIRIVLC
jgi:hypothetical protein